MRKTMSRKARRNNYRGWEVRLAAYGLEWSIGHSMTIKGAEAMAEAYREEQKALGNQSAYCYGLVVYPAR